MKKLTIIFSAIASLAFSGFREEGKWLIDPESRLTIFGKTNINNFSCNVDCYSTYDTLEYIREGKTCQLKFTKNSMTIPINNFDCGSRQITKDFYETLKGEVFPELYINFKSFENLPARGKSVVRGNVSITLAGVTRNFVVQYNATIPSEGILLLRGTQEVNFSDFRLKAPQKMMGLIQVQESLKVEFNLTLKSI